MDWLCLPRAPGGWKEGGRHGRDGPAIPFRTLRGSARAYEGGRRLCCGRSEHTCWKQFPGGAQGCPIGDRAASIHHGPCHRHAQPGRHNWTGSPRRRTAAPSAQTSAAQTDPPGTLRQRLCPAGLLSEALEAPGVPRGLVKNECRFSGPTRTPRIGSSGVGPGHASFIHHQVLATPGVAWKALKSGAEAAPDKVPASLGGWPQGDWGSQAIPCTEVGAEIRLQTRPHPHSPLGGMTQRPGPRVRMPPPPRFPGKPVCLSPPSTAAPLPELTPTPPGEGPGHPDEDPARAQGGSGGPSLFLLSRPGRLLAVTMTRVLLGLATPQPPRPLSRSSGGRALGPLGR